MLSISPRSLNGDRGRCQSKARRISSWRRPITLQFTEQVSGPCREDWQLRLEGLRGESFAREWMTLTRIEGIEL